jgi:ABC-type antimicrobial peptide transport system permease subunit
VRTESFPLVIPNRVCKGFLRIGEQSVAVFPFWPNGVRTSTCDLAGNLVYAKRGRVSDFDGQNVDGSIVLLDFDSGLGWLTAARLGARAIVFIEPETATRGEIDTKWSEVPTNVPRFWVSKSEGRSLIESAGRPVSLSCKQEWIDIQGENFMATISGTDLEMQDEWVVISAYADSASAVPYFAKGADQSSGLAALGTIVRYFKAHPPKRSVLFLVTNAHYQAMQGIRAFLDRRFREGWGITGGRTPQCFFTLDLSTHSTSVSSLAKGWWYDYRDENHEGERAISRSLMNHAPDIASILRMDLERVFFDGVNNPDGRHWKNNVPGRFGIEAEIINIAGANAITFMTSADVRDFQDTPHDIASRTNAANLATQTRTITCLLAHALNDTQSEIAGAASVPYRGAKPLRRMTLMSGFGTVEGRVLRYDPKHSFLPDVPVTGALVEYQQFYRSYMGIRGIEYHRARGSEAQYEILGVPAVTAWDEASRYPIAFMAYTLDDTGEIEQATDFGIQGGGQFTSFFMMTTSDRHTPIVVFPCQPVQLFGLIDPHRLKAINELTVLDSRNNGSPPSYSWVAPYGSFNLRSYVETSAVVFAPKNRHVKILGSSGPVDVPLMLVGATQDDVEGRGFDVADARTIKFPNLTSAKDQWQLSEWRRRLLAKYDIVNPGLDKLIQSSKRDIESAARAYAGLDFTSGDRLAQRAWGYSLRAYPKYRGMMSDTVNGLVFYLALLLPFCYFVERLFVSSTRLSTQILVGGAIFTLTFILLRLLHPAFEITSSTFMIFVAFTIGALSLIVTTFVIGKFELSLHKLQQIAGGVHDERVGKVSLAATALSIGISNMRRRRARTLLTVSTLTIVTFIILSFTSVVTDFRFNEMAAEGTPRYSGLLFRDREMNPVESSAFESLASALETGVPIGRRAWFYGGAYGSLSSLSLRSGTRSTSINALLGLDFEESSITRPQESLSSGRWFLEGERNAAILPRSLSARLGIGIGSEVIFGGVPLKVVGMVDDANFKGIVDLDNESIIPADFTQSRQMQDRGQGGDFAFRKYVRYDAGSVMVVPASFALHIGAEIRSVAAALPSYKASYSILQELMPRLSLNIYAGVPGKGGPEIRQFSTVASSRSRGFEYIVIPALIAILIVLNTMISSVYERQREIAIFSAVGISPKQIGALFFAESLVYGIVGTVVGYLLAMVSGALISRVGLLEGLSLNYSSLSSIYATAIVISVVLLSTVYPAKRAREIATPSGDSEWLADSPRADEWSITLPFTVTRSHAGALALFYKEWLAAFEDHNIGEFVSEDVSSSVHGREYSTLARVWLAPFDLGVQQRMMLRFGPTEMDDVYWIQLNLRRVSGDPENWENLNRRFLRALRKQFLVWRTLSPAEKEPYLRPLLTQ